MKDDFAENQTQLVHDLRSSPAVTFESRVALRSLHAGREGLLTAVEIEGASGRRSIDVSALFVAQHVVPTIDVVQAGAPSEAIRIRGLSRWHQLLEQVNDGARAAPYAAEDSVEKHATVDHKSEATIRRV
ncbi:MAG TPA: hypothetical protein VGF69_09830 [Thermoanaerobaculia bacterium]|jgi:hypothetical protein